MGRAWSGDKGFYVNGAIFFFAFVVTCLASSPVMEVRPKDTKMEKEPGDTTAPIRAYGPRRAKTIKRLIRQLEAAPNRKLAHRFRSPSFLRCHSIALCAGSPGWYRFSVYGIIAHRLA